MSETNIQMPLQVWQKFCKMMDISTWTPLSKKEFEKQEQKYLDLFIQDRFLIVTNGNVGLLWEANEDEIDEDVVACVVLPHDYLKQIISLKGKQMGDDAMVNINLAPHRSQCTIARFEVEEHEKEIPLERLHDAVVCSMTEEVMGKNAADRIIAAYRKTGEGWTSCIRLNTDLFHIMQSLFGNSFGGFNFTFPINQKVCLTPVMVELNEWYNISFRFFFLPWGQYDDYKNNEYLRGLNKLVPHLPPLKAKGE